jgi:hypothetical protein
MGIMKYIKLFENKNLIDNYVIIKTNHSYSDKYNKFLETHIGKIYHYANNHIFVRFNISDDNDINDKEVQVFKPNEIRFYSKDKNELEFKMDVNKYNL